MNPVYYNKIQNKDKNVEAGIEYVGAPHTETHPDTRPLLGRENLAT